MSKQRLGRATVKFNGKLLATEPGAKINIGGLERATGENTHEVYFTEALKASRVECVIPLGPDVSLDELRNLVEATVTFECDTGQTYIVARAWVENTLEVTDGEGGKVPVTFAGDPAEEVL